MVHFYAMGAFFALPVVCFCAGIVFAPPVVELLFDFPCWGCFALVWNWSGGGGDFGVLELLPVVCFSLGVMSWVQLYV